jgi:hypothetical protein
LQQSTAPSKNQKVYFFLHKSLSHKSRRNRRGF